MNPSVASLICAGAIAGLLYLDRDKTHRTSRGLWLPGIWITIVASRPISSWLGLRPGSNMQLDGSPFDAAIYGALLILAIGVLIRRRSRARTLLLANWPILIYFLYCLISVTWSYHPDVAFKRWIKAVGDLAMVLVIATEAQPMVAMSRLVSRVGFFLLPTSVLFIKYFGTLGRGYTSDGLPMNTGVTTNKNALGLIVLLVSLVVLWNVRSLLIHKGHSNRGRRLLAQGTLLAFGLALFVMAQCSTCKACFFLGGFLIIACNFRAIKTHPARLHALCFVVLLIAGGALLFGQAGVANALGRESSLSGRTEIWEAVIPAVPNSTVGAGFESFWISPNVRMFQERLLDAGWYPRLVEDLNEAHNGYIEIYLTLGWIGLSLVALVLIGGYRRSVSAFQRDPELGGLFLTFVIVAVFYNITEAGFRMLNPSWIFLLLAIVSASGVNVGLSGRGKPKIPASRNGKVSGTAAFNELSPAHETVHSARRG